MHDFKNQSSFNCGHTVLDFKCDIDISEPVLTVSLWYPSCIKKRENSTPLVLEKVNHKNLQIIEGKHPLFVFSHGYGYSGLHCNYLAIALASRGWIVASADHHDKYARWRIRTGRQKNLDLRIVHDYTTALSNSTIDDRKNYLYRIDEFRCMIDLLLERSHLSIYIDPNKIAVGGHSFGGFTAIGVCGTLPEYHDPRVKALVLLSSSGAGFFYTPSERASLHIPTMLFIGEMEKDDLKGIRTVSKWAEIVYRDLPPPKYFLEVKGAGHKSFISSYKKGNTEISPVKVLKQQNSISRYCAAFLEKYVLEETAADDILQNIDSQLTNYRQTVT